MDTSTMTPAAAAVEALSLDMNKALETFHGDLYRSGDPEVADLVKASAGLVRQAIALHLAAVGEFDSRGIAQSTGTVSTKKWLTQSLNQTPTVAGNHVKMARAIATNKHALVGEALASGCIEYDQARVTVETVEKLPGDCTEEQVDFTRDLMLETAEEHHATDLRRLGRLILNHADPDGKEPSEDTRVEAARSLSYRDNGDGTETMTYTDSTEQMVKHRAATGALDKPTSAADSRSTAQRRADAMRVIVEKALRTGDLPNSHGVAPHITLVADLDTLKGLDDAAYGALATGSALTPAAVRRLLCDSDITPIVLDKHGMPLSVGRTYRTVTPAIWKAIVARDTGCVGPGCDAPPWLCRAHHLEWWEHLGITSVDNGALLCDNHHTWVHHRGWDIRLDEHGIPEMIPPAWMDPERKPRKNFYWQAQRGLLIPPDFPSKE